MTEERIKELRHVARYLEANHGVVGAVDECLDEIERLRKENQELREQRDGFWKIAIRVADVIPDWSRLSADIEAMRARVEHELPTLEDVQKAYAQSKLTTETKG